MRQELARPFHCFYRSSDICCRYGGEEFAIIPLSRRRRPAMRADALRGEVKGLRLHYKKQPLEQLRPMTIRMPPEL